MILVYSEMMTDLVVNVAKENKYTPVERQTRKQNLIKETSYPTPEFIAKNSLLIRENEKAMERKMAKEKVERDKKMAVKKAIEVAEESARKKAKDEKKEAEKEEKQNSERRNARSSYNQGSRGGFQGGNSGRFNGNNRGGLGRGGRGGGGRGGARGGAGGRGYSGYGGRGGGGGFRGRGGGFVRRGGANRGYNGQFNGSNAISTPFKRYESVLGDLPTDLGIHVQTLLEYGLGFAIDNPSDIARARKMELEKFNKKLFKDFHHNLDWHQCIAESCFFYKNTILPVKSEYSLNFDNELTTRTLSQF